MRKAGDATRRPAACLGNSLGYTLDAADALPFLERVHVARVTGFSAEDDERFATLE